MNKSKAEKMESSQLTAPEGALEDAHRVAGNAPSGARPNPEVVATARRRQFTSGDKRRILEAADRCTQPGEIGALLRKKKGFTPPTYPLGASSVLPMSAPRWRHKSAGARPIPYWPRIAVYSNSPRKMIACAANWPRPMPSLMSKKNFAPCSDCRRTRRRTSAADASTQPVGSGDRFGSSLRRS